MGWKIRGNRTTLGREKDDKQTVWREQYLSFQTEG